MKKDFLGKIDFFFNKVIPKKLIVWIIATILIFLGKIDGNIWGIITGIYLGTNVLSKMFAPKEDIKDIDK